MHKLLEKGIRISLEAEQLLSKLSPAEIEQLANSGKLMVSKDDVEKIINERQQVEVKASSKFKPVAKEYSSEIEVSKTSEKHRRTKGEVSDFINYFRDRYEKLSKILQATRSNYPLIRLEDVKRHLNEKVRIIAMVYEKRTTKKGNILLTIEDLNGQFKVVISNSRNNEKLFEKAQNIILDDVISISGKVLEPFLIAEEIEWPDLPVLRAQKQTEKDVAAAYISDTHFGSRYFVHQYMDHFIDWINGKGEVPDLAAKIKYLVVAGDIADGVGVYPNHIKELAVPDIYKQYEMFDNFIEKLPDHIDVIIVPGNHDAVRRAEPMPSIDKNFIRSDVLSLPNPATLKIEGFKHVLYHGTSLDSLIANVPKATYTHPEKVMVEYLRRRHLSPIYGGNLIVPENTDSLVLEEEPDILHCGHVHKNGYAMYRNTLLINSGTFQDRTEFQIRQGHVPTPGMVPIYEFKTARLRTLDFRSV